jgi:hypothetical protein
MNNKEYMTSGKYCYNCSKLSKNACLDCYNCGIKNNKCQKGLFMDDTIELHNNNLWRFNKYITMPFEKL